MKVKVYSTSSCPYCKMEKEYLQEKGVEFEDILVDRDQDAVREMLEASGQLGVPVTIITTDDGEQKVIIGFDKPAIDQALNL